MSQWEKLQRLDSTYLEKLDELYNQGEFPMDVRHYLALWIESQDWDRASCDPAMASVLFQILLANLDNQHSRFLQKGAPFLVLRNIRHIKQNFQKYEENPIALAHIIRYFLYREREILQSALVTEQVQLLQVQPDTNEADSETVINQKMSELSCKVQEMGPRVKLLEDEQDEFHFKFKTSSGKMNMTDTVKKVLQDLLNALDSSRKHLLSGMTVLIDLAEDLLKALVKEELPAWHRRQQRACIGAPEDTCLNQLENWFTVEAECLLALRSFLVKLGELTEKVTYDPDPLKVQKPVLEARVNSLLVLLLKSAFVVENQPAVHHGMPLVLRTGIQFSVSVRFLFRVLELNHSMKVTLMIGRSGPQVKGCRRFNILGNCSKAMNMGESTSGGMMAEFGHLTLKEQKILGGSKSTKDVLNVTEELHTISFATVFELHGLAVPLQTSTLPVVIISGLSQHQSARASVLWFNMLCSDVNNTAFFSSPPLATWPQLSEVLSWQFLTATKKGLDSEHLEMIANKLFGDQQSYDNCIISWLGFSKENIPGTTFSFWVWFDGVLSMVRTYLQNLWNDGCIMGFISKDKTRSLLCKKMLGTFLLRFSESTRDGGITFSYVDYSTDGTATVCSVQPFTKADLAQIPLADILRTYQITEEHKIPQKPLKFLYPNIPKDQAFGKHYTVQRGEQSQNTGYMPAFFIFISKDAPLLRSSMSSLTDCGVMVPNLDDMNTVKLPAPDTVMGPGNAQISDPMLSGANTDNAVEELTTLQESIHGHSNVITMVMDDDNPAGAKSFPWALLDS